MLFSELIVNLLIIGAYIQGSGLARRVHGLATLQEWFEQLVSKDPNLSGDQHMLTKCVATHWDTDHDCLESHVHFKMQNQLLTANTKLNLKAYALSDAQWALADKMSTVLEVSYPFLIYNGKC
jgi:hypothetical protein